MNASPECPASGVVRFSIRLIFFNTSQQSEEICREAIRGAAVRVASA
jgi:hypothetical protein